MYKTKDMTHFKFCVGFNIDNQWFFLQCICQDGYAGTLCQIDIDDCASGPCQNNGQCLDGVGYYNCQCPEGYSGRNCESATNKCWSAPCMNGGSCTDLFNSYKCSCPPSYVGVRCEKSKS